MSKMSIAKADRPKVKAECLRLMVTLKLDPARSRLISKFVDTYLQLDGKEKQTFQAEIAKLDINQKEEIMETMTSWEREGLEKGRIEGKVEERRSIALNLLRQGVSIETIAQATGLTIDQLQQLQAEHPY
jgi:predicted transposase/invertase (TIGR01784 family)